MSLYAGRWPAEIVEFVHEYYAQPHGQKARWLAGQGVTEHRMKRWRAAVFDGDLDRGLIPRDGVVVSAPPERSAVAKRRAAEARRHEAELARLQARVEELEATNEALGKAIGLLHAMNAPEPAATPTTSDPSSSCTPKMDSSPS